MDVSTQDNKVQAEDKVVPVAEIKKLQERIRRLERLLGPATRLIRL